MKELTFDEILNLVDDTPRVLYIKNHLGELEGFQFNKHTLSMLLDSVYEKGYLEGVKTNGRKKCCHENS